MTDTQYKTVSKAMAFLRPSESDEAARNKWADAVWYLSEEFDKLDPGVFDRGGFLDECYAISPTL